MSILQIYPLVIIPINEEEEEGKLQTKKKKKKKTVIELRFASLRLQSFAVCVHNSHTKRRRGRLHTIMQAINPESSALSLTTNCFLLTRPYHVPD